METIEIIKAIFGLIILIFALVMVKNLIDLFFDFAERNKLLTIGIIFIVLGSSFVILNAIQ